ncbi:acetate--CoA ligase family protein [Chloroflexota bacterium]
MVSDETWRLLFDPDSVAVIGASDRPGSWGQRIMRSLLYPKNRKIYAVNPTSPEVAGLKTYKSITDIPDPVELGVIVVQAPLVADAMRDCVKKGIKAAVVIAGGFTETGEEGAVMEAEVIKIAESGGIKFIGPNTMGHLDASTLLNTVSFLEKTTPGEAALISQSGNMGTRIMQIARGYGIGFNKFVCCGNEASIRLEDYLEYFAKDPGTKLIVLYMEGLRDAKRFIKVAREITVKKPIIAMKSGATEVSKRASRSHTGAIAGSNAVYTAAFKQAGVIRVQYDDELCDTALALLNLPLPEGNRVGILTMGGGLGVVAAEACENAGLNVADLEQKSIEKLNELLPDRWSKANPVDLVGSNLAHGGDILQALWILLEDKNLDAIVANTWLGRNYNDPRAPRGVIDSNDKNRSEEENVRKFRERVGEYGKPLIMVGSPPQSEQDINSYLLFHKEGFLVCPQPYRAAMALNHANWYRQYLESRK